MKSLSQTLLSLCSALCVSVIPISTHAATSDPVGAMTVTVSAGNVPIAPSFVNPTEFQGSVSSVSLSGEELTITLASSLLSSSAYDESSYPLYYLEVTSAGDFEGAYFDIIMNTASSLTILTWSGTDQPIASGDTFLIRKHVTLGSFFADAEDTLLAYADSVKMFYPGNITSTIFWDGSKWTKDFASNDSDHPIYPGQGFLTLFASQQTFTVFGSVKTTPTQVPAYSGDINFVGTLSPVDVSFSDLNTIVWMSPYADSFKLFLGDGSLSSSATVFSDGSSMTNFVSNFDSQLLIAGSAFLLVPASNVNWKQPAAYTSN